MEKLSFKEKMFRVLHEIEQPKKNSVNPYFKSKYADLAEVKRVVDDICRKYRLYVQQGFKENSLHTVIQDVDNNGAFLVTLSLPTNVKPQDLGSAITYYRRYSLVTMFGLIAEDDDDGNQVSRTPANKQKKTDVIKDVFEIDASKWQEYEKKIKVTQTIKDTWKHRYELSQHQAFRLMKHLIDNGIDCQHAEYSATVSAWLEIEKQIKDGE